jgi:hypothetical protein
MAQSWKTDRWFTSHLNFEPAAREGIEFAPKIEFHDVSLRDGEQQTGLVFNADPKVRIADKLDEVGIHRIEAGLPMVSLTTKEQCGPSPAGACMHRSLAFPAVSWTT